MSTEVEKDMTELNMMSSPIGPIPHQGVDPITKKVVPCEYFEKLCTAAQINLRDGEWCILSEHIETKELVRGKVVKKSSVNTEKHMKFMMLMDVVRTMVMQQLERDGTPNAKHLAQYIVRDDLLRCCLGLTDEVTVSTANMKGPITVFLGAFSPVCNGTTQAVFDWLNTNSKIDEYTARKRSFQDNLNIKKPDWATKKGKMDEDDNHLDDTLFN